MTKSRLLCNCINEVFKDKATASPGAGGFLIEMEVKKELLKNEVKELCKEKGLLIKDFYFKAGRENPCILLSCSGVSSEEFYPAMKFLKEMIF